MGIVNRTPIKFPPIDASQGSRNIDKDKIRLCKISRFLRLTNLQKSMNIDKDKIVSQHIEEDNQKT